MIFGVYSVRDLKAINYGSPVLAANDDVAMRDFRLAVINSKGSVLSDFRSDYCLMKIATFDSDNGIISPCEHIVVLDGNSIPKE